MSSECHVLHSLEFPFLLCSVCLQQRVWDCHFGSVLCLAVGPNTNTPGFKSPSSSQKPGVLQEPLWFMAKFPGGSVTSQATLHRILVIPTHGRSVVTNTTFHLLWEHASSAGKAGEEAQSQHLKDLQDTRSA